jgi:hypothetical protein
MDGAAQSAARNSAWTYAANKKEKEKDFCPSPLLGHACTQALNEAAADNIRKYRADYNNNPPNAISFMPAIASTSGRLHSEFVCLLFLQDHRETDLFFAASGVQLAHSTSGQFHYRRAAFSSQIKSLESKIVNILTKTSVLHITLNIDGVPVPSRSHTHPSHSQTSRLLTSSLCLGVPVPLTTQCMRGV